MSEFVALYKKVTPSFRSSHELVLYVYADSLDLAKDIVHKFYIEHYVFEGVFKSVNYD